MKTIEIKLFKLEELSPEAQARAVQENYYINTSENWWENTYEEAEAFGLKITGFDLDRGNYCKGNFTNGARYFAEEIVKHFGESVRIHSTCTAFLADLDNINAGGGDVKGLEEEFLGSACEDYKAMLRDEYEALTSEEAIRETLTANEREFLEDGKIYY